MSEVQYAIAFSCNPEKIISDRTGRYIAREIFELAKFGDNMPQKVLDKWTVFFNSGSPDAVMSDRTGRILAHLLGVYYDEEAGLGLPEDAAEFNPTKAISDRTGRLIVRALALHSHTETGGKDTSFNPPSQGEVEG